MRKMGCDIRGREIVALFIAMTDEIKIRIVLTDHTEIQWSLLLKTGKTYYEKFGFTYDKESDGMKYLREMHSDVVGKIPREFVAIVGEHSRTMSELIEDIENAKGIPHISEGDFSSIVGIKNLNAVKNCQNMSYPPSSEFKPLSVPCEFTSQSKFSYPRLENPYTFERNDPYILSNRFGTQGINSPFGQRTLDTCYNDTFQQRLNFLKETSVISCQFPYIQFFQILVRNSQF